MSGRMSQFRRVMKSTNRPFVVRRSRRPASASATRSRGKYSNHRSGDDQIVVRPRVRERLESKHVGLERFDVLDGARSERLAEPLEHGRREVEAVEGALLDATTNHRISQGERDDTGTAACVEHAEARPQERRCEKVASKPLGIAKEANEADVALVVFAEEPRRIRCQCHAGLVPALARRLPITLACTQRTWRSRRAPPPPGGPRRGRI